MFYRCLSSMPDGISGMFEVSSGRARRFLPKRFLVFFSSIGRDQAHKWQREHEGPSLQPLLFQKYLQGSPQLKGCPTDPAENSGRGIEQSLSSRPSELVGDSFPELASIATHSLPSSMSSSSCLSSLVGDSLPEDASVLGVEAAPSCDLYSMAN